MAALTEAVGLSLALGAFLGGMLLGSSDFVKKLEHQTLPLRDAFVAVFFVSVGMLIDPRTWRCCVADDSGVGGVDFGRESLWLGLAW